MCKLQAEDGSQEIDPESDEDDAYWRQYDHYNGQILRDNSSTAKDIASQEQELSNYFDRYDNIETAIGDAEAVQDHSAGNEYLHGKRLPTIRTEDFDIGLEEYVRNTLRNLSQLVLRSGMSKSRLIELVNEGLN